MKRHGIMVVARGWRERRKGNNCLTGIEFQFYKMKRVLGVDGGGNGCTTM